MAQAPPLPSDKMRPSGDGSDGHNVFERMANKASSGLAAGFGNLGYSVALHPYLTFAICVVCVALSGVASPLWPAHPASDAPAASYNIFDVRA